MKLLGYIIALVGLVILILSFFVAKISFLASVKPIVPMIAGAIVIVIGIALTMGSGGGKSVKQASEEVPIYEGTGKTRKIVGYRRESKK